MQFPKSRRGMYLQCLKGSWWMIISSLLSSAMSFAAPLQEKFPELPAISWGITGIIFVLFFVQIFSEYRKVWGAAAAEKREMQKRFDAEDAALFGTAKNMPM